MLGNHVVCVHELIQRATERAGRERALPVALVRVLSPLVLPALLLVDLLALCASVVGVAVETAELRVAVVDVSNVNMEIDYDRGIVREAIVLGLVIEANLGLDVDGDEILGGGDPVGARFLDALVATVAILFVIPIAALAVAVALLKGKVGRAGHGSSGQSKEGSSELHICCLRLVEDTGGVV